ncbi:TMEM175 family protein [Weissella confusa]|uniref:TMEM175 family protein n=1 Tax=Weissella confusa TaxID=1583 RepID=UPI0035A37203
MTEKFDLKKAEQAKLQLSDRYYAKPTINRLNGLIDAVLAIVATIMVLALKLPIKGAHDWTTIQPILIGIAIFVVSFIVVVNQYVTNMRMFNLIHKINPVGMLLVFSWLAVLALLPFFTRWMFEDWHNRYAVLGYGIIYVLASVLQQSLLLNLVKTNFNPDEMAEAGNNSLAQLYHFAFNTQARLTGISAIVLLIVATIWPTWGFWLFILVPIVSFVQTLFEGELKDRINDQAARWRPEEQARVQDMLNADDESISEKSMDMQEKVLQRLFWRRLSPEKRADAQKRFDDWRDEQRREQAEEQAQEAAEQARERARKEAHRRA